MSIHDLLEKINGSAMPTDIKSKYSIYYLLLIILAVCLGLSSLGEGMYLISRFRESKPVQITCPEDIMQALQASSTPISSPKVSVKHTKKQPKARKEPKVISN